MFKLSFPKVVSHRISPLSSTVRTSRGAWSVILPARLSQQVLCAGDAPAQSLWALCVLFARMLSSWQEACSPARPLPKWVSGVTDLVSYSNSLEVGMTMLWVQGNLIPAECRIIFISDVIWSPYYTSSINFFFTVLAALIGNQCQKYLVWKVWPFNDRLIFNLKIIIKTFF